MKCCNAKRPGPSPIHPHALLCGLEEGHEGDHEAGQWAWPLDEVESLQNQLMAAELERDAAMAAFQDMSERCNVERERANVAERVAKLLRGEIKELEELIGVMAGEHPGMAQEN